MILLGLLNLLLSTGNSLNVDRMEEEGIVNEGVYPEMISPAGDLVDGNTIYPFEHFQRISHSLAPENAFVFRVNCTGIAPSDCQEAKESLKNAGIRIANSLLFRNPVNVHVQFKVFDKPGELFAVIPNYGYAARKDNGQLLKYPSAAIRQRADSSPGPSIPNNEFDMWITFDLDESWVFDLGQGGFQSKLSVDFEYAALQAITHGLGFQSTLKDYKYRSRIKVHYMTPEIVKTNIGSQCYFSPISAFDNLVVGTRFEIGRLGASISTFPNFNCDSIESYLRAFELSPFIEPAKNLLEIIKSDKLWIRPNLRDPISVVYTPSKSGSGAKVHLNATRSARADFMMTGEPKRGGTLRQRLDSMGIRTIYGRNTLKIMEGLGYATQMNPLFPVMEVSTTFATTHYNPNDAQWRVNLDFL